MLAAQATPHTMTVHADDYRSRLVPPSLALAILKAGAGSQVKLHLLDRHNRLDPLQQKSLRVWRISKMVFLINVAPD